MVYDIQMLFAVLFLVGISLVMVYSASSALALKKYGSGYYYLKRQALFSFFGILALITFSNISYRIYRFLAYPVLIIAFGLLLAVAFSSLAISAGGSQRWLRLGPICFQPGEVVRVGLIIFLAYSLNKKQDSLKRISIGFIPHVILLIFFIALFMLQPDFGSAIIFGAITWLMMFVAGVPLLHLTGALLVSVPVAYFLIMSADYRLKRLVSFLDPWKNPAAEGYQMIHSLMAFGTGGVWGTGFGKGYQKLFYLPEPHTDFIFAVIGEELGFIGVLSIIGLYGIVLWRGTLISLRCKENFGILLAAGLTFALSLHISINMGVTLGLLPTKGLTLPFISYGGTSLIINMACIGMLMNIGAGNG
ncbi:MAG: putative lipid II flippase FtsW [Desulfobacteraceae bacterium]|nr:putative lipid II flippase FtsW [Desulfobacteraceae bacterium]